MKVLVVFLGLLTMLSSMLFYQGDMGRYTRGRAFLKALAEECAAGAALYFDESEYAEGRLVFNQDEGMKYISHLLENTQMPPELKALGAPSCEALFYDDESGYGQDVGGHAIASSPSVAVKLSIHTEDIFRLPFLSVIYIERQAMYELPAP
ncbi:MAG: hypothetical protein LBH39_07830 [Clostridiales Family XIII bacterium]|nr:hypothetical protein [Clostridiales Family XIII bacterium]